MTILARSTIPLTPMSLKFILLFFYSLDLLQQAKVNVTVGFDWIINILNEPITNSRHMIRGQIMITFHLTSTFNVFLPLGALI